MGNKRDDGRYGEEIYEYIVITTQETPEDRQSKMRTNEGQTRTTQGQQGIKKQNTQQAQATTGQNRQTQANPGQQTSYKEKNAPLYTQSNQTNTQEANYTNNQKTAAANQTTVNTDHNSLSPEQLNAIENNEVGDMQGYAAEENNTSSVRNREPVGSGKTK